MSLKILHLLIILLVFVFSCKKKNDPKVDANTIILDDALCLKPNRYVPNEQVPTPKDLALDAHCANYVIQNFAPNGVVTIFGSARATEEQDTYQLIYEFAKKWSEQFGDQYPILTGGGPGIMDAGNRGAKEANKKSLYFATYFGENKEPLNPYVTHGYMFSSFSQREAEMVDKAVAVVIAPGGFGTEWEIFETLAKLQTKKVKKYPVILLGKKKYWKSLLNRINFLKKNKTISPDDVKLITNTESVQKAIDIIKEGLNL